MTFSSLRVASILSAALLGCLTATGLADILADGVPNVEDTRLYAWYDGDQAIGEEGGPLDPLWPNRQGDPRRDLTEALPGADAVLEPVPTENEHLALRFVDVAIWGERGQFIPDTEDYSAWGVVEEQMTVFVAATVRDPNAAFLFAGNQPNSGTEANAGFPAGVIEPGYWSFTAGADRIRTAPLTVDQLQYHAFTFRPDASGAHHLNGELVGAGNAGLASLQGFVIGGRAGGFQRGTIDLAEILVYREALSDTDRQAIESYLQLKYLGPIGVPGDFDGDGELTVDDIDLLTAASAADTNEPKYDLNQDALVNGDDVYIWAKDLKRTWIGDADVNLEFNSGDFVQAFAAGKYEIDEPAVWSQGDWDGSGRFDSGDFIAAFSDGGYEIGPRTNLNAVSAVPEPSAVLLLALGMMGLVARSRRS